MKKGALFKRCACRDEAGASLGERCRKLKRPNGSWISGHGSWYFQLEVDTPEGHDRAHLRRGGFATREQAAKVLGQTRDLLALAERAEFPHRARMEIATLIRDALKARRDMPDADQVRRTVDLGHPVASDLTVGVFLVAWVEGKKRTRAGNTYRSYKQHIDQYLVPKLGEIPLARLRVSHVNTAFAQIADEAAHAAANNAKRCDAQDAHRRARRARDEEAATRAKLELASLAPFQPVPGPVTVQRIRATLRSALSSAAKESLVAVNVAKLAELPVARKPKAKLWTALRIQEWKRTGEVPGPVMVWTAEHTKVFLKRAAGHRYYALYTLISYLGLRRGEAVGLRWSNLDFSTGEITIDSQFVQQGWQIVESQTKTEAGEHTVIAPKPVLTVLAKHRRRQYRWMQKAGDHWYPGEGQPSPYAFTDEHGYPLHPDEVLEQFRALTREAGLPRSGCTTSGTVPRPWPMPLE